MYILLNIHFEEIIIASNQEMQLEEQIIKAEKTKEIKECVAWLFGGTRSQEARHIDRQTQIDINSTKNLIFFVLLSRNSLPEPKYNRSYF